MKFFMFDRLCAGILVTFVHVCIALLLFSNTSRERLSAGGEIHQRTRLVILNANSIKVLTAVLELPQAPANFGKPSAKPIYAGMRDQDSLITQEPSTDGVDSALNLHWTDPVAQKIEFRQDPLQSRNPVGLGLPTRFKLRTPVSVKSMLELISKGSGMWPPGYTTDPCPEIKRNVAGLLADISPAGRSRLEEEMRREQAYCR